MTPQRLVVSKAASGPEERRSIAFDEPASLRAPVGGPRGLLLDVSHLFEMVPYGRHWQVSTRMYEFRLLDHHHKELMVYHWQPGSEFAGPDQPHLHVSAALQAQIDAQTAQTIDLDRRHVATGRVSLEAVVRMLITEFQIAPQRSDWQRTLDRTEAAFREEITRGT